MNVHDEANENISNNVVVQQIVKEVEWEIRNNPKLNAKQVCRVKYVQYLLKGILCNGRCDIGSRLGVVSRDFGVVSIEGETIEFNNQGLFLQAVALADNFEVYPKLNGDLVMNFGFYKILKNHGGIENE